MNTQPNPIYRSIQQKIQLFLSISLGIFLFILFFQPFTLASFEFNDRLLFVAGFAGIVFFLLFAVHYLKILMAGDMHDPSEEIQTSTLLSDLIFVALTSVAFAFYLRYVGNVQLSFFILFKLVLICIFIPVVVRIHEQIGDLNKQNSVLRSEVRRIGQQMEQYTEDTQHRHIEFVSENATENLNLPASHVSFIRSADNYVEIFYFDEDQMRKKLVRNTLRNIEAQTRAFAGFLRCHRTCIVNLRHVEKLKKNLGNYSLFISGFDKPLPVSRQYLIKLREALNPSGGE